jgi:hypothetical protein
MKRLSLNLKNRNRGVIAVLAAVFCVVMMALIAFAVDIGYLGVSRTQLQAAADSAALAAAATTNQGSPIMVATAQQFATANTVGSRQVELSPSDVKTGTWDTTSRTFTESASGGNAVKVTVRADENHGGRVALFFGKVFGRSGVDQSATAIATCNPRDIAFVIDLSGTMNDDTEPDSTATINSTYAPQGYPTVGTDLINQVYADFGYPVTYGTEPAVQFIGQPLGITKGSSKSNTLAKLTNNTYSPFSPLMAATIPSQYRILSTDNLTVCTTKAYSWIMDVQMPAAQVMPGVKPVPNSANSGNYAYWKSYIDYYWDKLGYRSYVQFMMYYGGRTTKPGGTLYSPLSQFSPDCPWHAESTAGGTFNFPPREMPTHAGRRAIIAALQIVKTCNQSISDPSQRDWVSLITFDAKSNGPTIQVPLTNNYDAAMQGCRTLQAVADTIGSSTDTEVGLSAAANHIKYGSGGSGRQSTNKIVVLMTDGMPNQYESSSTAISNYRTAHSSANFYGGSSYYSQDAALMQTSMMQVGNWQLYPVGIGLGCDYSFMDRMARMGSTANTDGHSARGTGNPAQYEAVLTGIFNKIITNPKLRIVK